MPETENATGIVRRLLAALGNGAKEAEYEGFCAGDAHLPVARVAVCVSPTVDLLRYAAAEKRTLIISREHPLYTHGTWYASGTPAALTNDPVARAKRELIGSSGLVIYRLSSLWDQAKTGTQAAALAEALGWHPEPEPLGTPQRRVICRIPPTSLAGLASSIGSRLGMHTVRGVGDRGQTVSRVAIVTGYVDVPAFAAATRDARVDAVLAGDACEWEGGPYVKDLMDSGRKVGVVYAGFAATEAPGVKAMAKWVRSALPGVDVKFVPVPEPSRLP